MLSCDCILKEWVFVVIDTKSAKFLKSEGVCGRNYGFGPLSWWFCGEGVRVLESLKVKSVIAI